MRAISSELDDYEDLAKTHKTIAEKNSKKAECRSPAQGKALKEVERLAKMMGYTQEAAVIRAYLEPAWTCPGRQSGR